MTNDRPTISREIEREVLMEAGYRCAMPRCNHSTTEIAHIVPYKESKDNSFENLIALCPNHHTMYDYEKKIDVKAMKIIKSKLGIINGRYSDFEKRVLKYFVENPAPSTTFDVTNGKESEAQLFYLIKDGLIQKTKVDYPPEAAFAGGYKLAYYELTQKGKDFIKKWLDPEKEIM